MYFIKIKVISVVDIDSNLARFIYRVKELGPGGPVEGKPADILPPEDSNFGALSPQNSDLARLQQTNVSKLSTNLVQMPCTLICFYT